MMRKCTKCHKIKLMVEFYTHKAKKDGIEASCKDCCRLKQRVYYKEHIEEVKQYQIEYNKKSRKKINSRVQKRKKEDVHYYLASTLRIRLNKYLTRENKSGSAVKDLGCTVAELKQHLESKFQPGMTWENRGQWHIDHIKPLASFILTDRNLQPLWAQDNIRKGNKYDSGC